jgi:predicted RNA-binding protein with TRAM domain
MPYAARGFDRDLSKSVEVGKEYEVEIQEISRRGDGIARIEGLVVFIPNTKQGDKLRIKITNVSRRFAEAEVINKTIEETGETK